jgi:hypothetical protein
LTETLDVEMSGLSAMRKKARVDGGESNGKV